MLTHNEYIKKRNLLEKELTILNHDLIPAAEALSDDSEEWNNLLDELANMEYSISSKIDWMDENYLLTLPVWCVRNIDTDKVYAWDLYEGDTYAMIYGSNFSNMYAICQPSCDVLLPPHVIVRFSME